MKGGISSEGLLFTGNNEKHAHDFNMTLHLTNVTCALFMHLYRKVLWKGSVLHVLVFRDLLSENFVEGRLKKQKIQSWDTKKIQICEYNFFIPSMMTFLFSFSPKKIKNQKGQILPFYVRMAPLDLSESHVIIENHRITECFG